MYNITECDFTTRGIKQVLNGPSLIDLGIKVCTFDASEKLDCQSNLEKLNLSKNGWGEGDHRYSRLLSCLPNLKAILFASENDVRYHTFANLARWCPQLEKVTIMGMFAQHIFVSMNVDHFLQLQHATKLLQKE